ncbi:MAG: diol dehydratase small subunit [Desulfobacterales bacterium]|nr:diol dehydratase small subunit [Desulfobacterales bacterium]
MKKIEINIQDYPFGTKKPEMIKTLTGKRLDEITLDSVRSGEITENDIRISPETLLLQAEVAEKSKRKFLGKSFRRAAELCNMPDEKIMEIYNLLRPFRCTKQELNRIADELEQSYNAVLNAELVREACAAYEERGFLKK